MEKDKSQKKKSTKTSHVITPGFQLLSFKAEAGSRAHVEDLPVLYSEDSPAKESEEICLKIKTRKTLEL